MALKSIEQHITGTICIFFFISSLKPDVAFTHVAYFSLVQNLVSVSIVTFKMPNSHMWPAASLLANMEIQALVRGTTMQPLLIQKYIADSVVLWVKDDVIQFKRFLDTLTGWGRDQHIFLIFKPPLNILFVSVFILPGWSPLQGPSHVECLVPHHGSR